MNKKIDKVEKDLRPPKPVKPSRIWFYLNGKLHKIIRVVPASDLVECYVHSESKNVLYAWSYVRKTRRPAFTRTAVARLLDRHPVSISRYLVEGVVPEPERSYIPKRPDHGSHYWSEDDVLNLHSYLLTKHQGRPRADGATNPGKLPSRDQLLAKMRTNTNMYVKTATGDFVPVWRAKEW